MSFYGYIELQRCTVITDSALAVMAVTVQCQCSAAVFVHCSRPCSCPLRAVDESCWAREGARVCVP